MRGGEGFARSIGSGLDKLADGLGKFLEKRREEGKLEVANGKAALATLKASPSLQKSLNITPEDAERMSPAERSAAVFGGLAGMKQEEGFRAGQAQTAKILADALTQRQEAEGNTAFDLAQAAASRPGTMEIPNTTLPGIFPDRTVGTRSQPTLQEAAQQILQTPGAARSRAGIQLLEAAAREREQQMGKNDPLDRMKAETEQLRVNTWRKKVEAEAEDDSTAATKDYTSADFKFGTDGNPTHWRVGDSFVKWNPKMQLVPGSKRGTVRVIPPPSNPMAALFGGQPPADVPESTPASATNAPTVAPMDDFKAWLQKKK